MIGGMKSSLQLSSVSDGASGSEPQAAAAQQFSMKAGQWQQQPSATEQKWFVTRWKEAAQQSFSAKMPDWALKYSTQITNAGLLFFTSLMIHSAFRGKYISGEIFKAQEKLVGTELGLEGGALADKVGELVAAGKMKIPALHRQRMTYLGTALASFMTGMVFKPQAESAEQMQKYEQMSWPEYMGTRVFQALDPVHHSRQTVGVLGAVSGILAAKSGLTQPGGVLWSELVVGATLVAGFSSLMMIKDPDKAKEAFSACWWARLPVVVTGTYETLMTYPAYQHPMASELAKTDAFKGGAADIARDGFTQKGFFGLWNKTLQGEKAVEAFTKEYFAHKLPFRRMDFAYPIGQWGNLGFAAFGLLTAGAAAKLALQSTANTPETPDHKIQSPEHKEILRPAPRTHGVPTS